MKEARQFEERSIDCLITPRDYDRIRRYVDFLEVCHYPTGDIPMKNELGKIDIIGGPVKRFHPKKPSLDAKIMIWILEDIIGLGSTLPQAAILKLKDTLKTIKNAIDPERELTEEEKKLLLSHPIPNQVKTLFGVSHD